TAIAVDASSSGGEVWVYNYSGSTITATGDVAIGIRTDSDSYVYILNEGDLVADGTTAGFAVVSNGTGDNVILNYGLMTGGVITGDGNDYLYNDDIWNPGAYSEFGAGDDRIVNTEDGVINFDDSHIFLGSFSDAGNSFVNYGLINVAGDNNLIHMGTGPDALVPSLNPIPFYNYGVIDFQDGDPDDVLVIVGDFAGEGQINVDADATTEEGDLLYIDGSVVDGTVQTINVDL